MYCFSNSILYCFSVIQMPDLVQNHSMAISSSSSPLTTTMQHHLHGRNELQSSMPPVERHNYRGHPVDHLIRPPTEHYSESMHRSVIDMSNQHESTDALHQVPGTKLI